MEFAQDLRGGNARQQASDFGGGGRVKLPGAADNEQPKQSNGAGQKHLTDKARVVRFVDDRTSVI